MMLAVRINNMMTENSFGSGMPVTRPWNTKPSGWASCDVSLRPAVLAVIIFANFVPGGDVEQDVSSEGLVTEFTGIIGSLGVRWEVILLIGGLCMAEVGNR